MVWSGSLSRFQDCVTCNRNKLPVEVFHCLQKTLTNHWRGSLRRRWQVTTPLLLGTNQACLTAQSAHVLIISHPDLINTPTVFLPCMLEHSHGRMVDVHSVFSVCAGCCRVCCCCNRAAVFSNSLRLEVANEKPGGAPESFSAFWDHCTLSKQEETLVCSTNYTTSVSDEKNKWIKVTCTNVIF